VQYIAIHLPAQMDTWTSSTASRHITTSLISHAEHSPHIPH